MARRDTDAIVSRPTLVPIIVASALLIVSTPSACRPHVSACRLRAIPCRGDQTAVHADQSPRLRRAVEGLTGRSRIERLF